LIDFDHAVHDTLNREDRTVRSVHNPSPNYWNCVVSDGSIAGNDSIHGGSAPDGGGLSQA
jgi:hypothetical protein